ncbi:glycosyltransferase family 2 protein [Flavobacterium sp.]|uniref:glycosyltransferase family 2 protein n=1 Tax=Flavobacterium sp. TaxID=239 RepID=UPI0033403AAF
MKVSVALCTYNGEKYIVEQLDSILNQTKPVDEIVICDDISTDGTHDIIYQYCSKFPNIIKFHINDVNLKSVKNFEKAISLCTGDVIFLSDQDDIWLPEKVADIVHHFELNPQTSVVATNGNCIDENSELIEDFLVWDVPQLFIDKKIHLDYYYLISCFFNIATGATMAIRSKFINECVPFPLIPNFHHDEWIARVACSKGQFSFLPKKYIYYRLHDAQQVGGIIYESDEESKIELLNLLDLTNYEITFFEFKRRIKRLCTGYNNNKKLAQFDVSSDVFNNTLSKICNLVENYKLNMKKKYPISAFFLNYTDKILNKRQLN